MPENELEKHPFLNSIEDHKFGPDYFEGLIVGSFPVYSITNSVFPVEVERFEAANANMKYFYGSNQNSFWLLMSQVFEVPNPAEILPFEERVTQAKYLLIRKKLLITDSIFKTNRIGEDAQDSALMITSQVEFVNQNKSLNFGMDVLLQRNSNIKYLYFTSTETKGKNPFGWFRKIFGNRLHFNVFNQVGNRVISGEVIIDSRKYYTFFLLSPAGNGMRGLHFTDDRRAQILVNYIQSVDPIFYQEIDPIPIIQRTPVQTARLTQLREGLLLESWRQAFVEKNLGFDGGM